MVRLGSKLLLEHKDRPTMRVVIADAGPLIALARIGQLNLLPQLFANVAVTKTVAMEVSQGGDFPDTQAIAEALAQPWLKTVTQSATDIALCQAWLDLYQIDQGEASSMVLAKHYQAQEDTPLLLIDDARGRYAATHETIPVLGTAGMLVLAKKAGWVSAVKPLLSALQQNHYFLSATLVAAVLAQANEQ